MTGTKEYLPISELDYQNYLKLIDARGPLEDINAYLLEMLRSLISAFDEGALEMNSPEIDGEPSGGYGFDQESIPPHPWHEEWLFHARAIIDRANEESKK